MNLTEAYRAENFLITPHTLQKTIIMEANTVDPDQGPYCRKQMREILE